MPNIPKYEQLRISGPAGVNQGGDAALGQSIMNLGRVIQGAGNSALSEASLKQARDNQTRIATQRLRSKNEFESSLSQLGQDYLQETGFSSMSVDDLEVKMENDISRYRNLALEGLDEEDPDREYLEAQLEGYENRVKSEILSNHSKAILIDAEEGTKALINRAANMVLDDPTQIANGLADIRENLTHYADALGEDRVQVTINESTVTLLQAAVYGLMREGDFNSARSLVNDGLQVGDTVLKFDSLLKVGDKQKFNTAINAAETSKKNADSSEITGYMALAAQMAGSIEDIQKLNQALADNASVMTTQDKLSIEGAVFRAGERVRRSQEGMQAEIDAGEKARIEAERKRIAADAGVAVSRVGTLEEIVNLRTNLDNLRANGWLSDSKWETETKNLDKKQVEIADQNIGIQLVSNALSGEGPRLDPKSPNTQKQVDAFWMNETIPTISQMPPEQIMADYPAAVGSFVKNTGVVRSDVKRLIRTASIDGNPEQFVLASRTVQVLSQQGKLGGLPKQEIAPLLISGKLIDLGIDPKEAIERARSQTNLSDKPLMARRDEELKQIFKDSPDIVSDWLDENYIDTGFFSSDNAATPSAMARAEDDLELLYKDWYRRTGDEDESKKLALSDFNKKWGISKLNGSERFMAFSPEATYGVLGDIEADSEWIQEQLDADIKDLLPADLLAKWNKQHLQGAEYKRNSPVNAEVEKNIVLSFVPGTELAPMYHLLMKDDFGQYLPLPDENSPDGLRRWYPHWEASEAYKKQQDALSQEKKDSLRIMYDIIDIETEEGGLPEMQWMRDRNKELKEAQNALSNQ